MATLKARDFELEFSYYDISCCNEVEYSLDIKFNGKPFLNPEIISESPLFVKNNKFLFYDCYNGFDWIYVFFRDILKTKKGSYHETMESPVWYFNAITWYDQQEERENTYKGKTVITKNEDNEIIDIPYLKTIKRFAPLSKENINLIIEFPSEMFETQDEDSTFILSFETTFFDLKKFFEKFEEEMKQFFDFWKDRVEYTGNGEFIEKDRFKEVYDSLDNDLYLIKKRTEWKNEHVEPDDEILLKLLLGEYDWHKYTTAVKTKYILESSISNKLAREVFDLAEKRLQKEKNKKTRKELDAIKTSIVIVFPDEFTDFEIKDALSKIIMEDISEEIFDKNKLIYLKHLKGGT